MHLASAIFAGLLNVMICSSVAVSQPKARSCPTPSVVQDEKYRPGQIWQYKTRSGEESSTVTILRVESLPTDGVIVHLRVDRIRLKNCTGGPEPDKFEHMPFAKEAIGRSLIRMLKAASKVPDFENGYKQWQEDCGGVYTITVAEAIAVAEQTLQHGLGCDTANNGSSTVNQ
jgi:hypothetical protein